MTPAELSHTVLRAVRRAVDDGEFDAAAAEPGAGKIVVERPRPGGYGDYATNAALQLSRPAGRPPRQVAEVLKGYLGESEGIAGVSVTGPGFLNLRLRDSAAPALVARILGRGTRYGFADAPTGQLVRLHAPHEVRAVVVMDATARILRSQGALVRTSCDAPPHPEWTRILGVEADTAPGTSDVSDAALPAPLPIRPTPVPAGATDPVRLGRDAARWALLHPAPHDLPHLGDQPRHPAHPGDQGREDPHPSDQGRGDPYLGDQGRGDPYLGDQGREDPTLGAQPQHDPPPGAQPQHDPHPGDQPQQDPPPGAQPQHNPHPGAQPQHDPPPGATPSPQAPPPSNPPQNNPLLVQRDTNPLFRVRYAHARTHALHRNAADLGFTAEPGAVSGQEDLVAALADHPRVLRGAAQDRAPDRLARHLVEVAGLFLAGLDATVLPRGEEKPSAAHRARLALAEAVGTVLAGGLTLLGIDAPAHL